MRIHEFGTEHEKTVLLLHSACLSWRMFHPAVERLQTQYHLIIRRSIISSFRRCRRMARTKRRHTRAWRPSRPSWAAG